MTNLRVAELSVRQADSAAGGLQGGMRPGCEIVIEMRCVRQCPGIVCTAGIESEAVKYGKQDGSGFHAASTITLTGVTNNGTTAFPALMPSTLTVVLNTSKFPRRHLGTRRFKISVQSGNKRIVPLISSATKLVSHQIPGEIPEAGWWHAHRTDRPVGQKSICFHCP